MNDIFETHGYKQGQELIIKAEFLLGVLNFCERVIESQPKVAVPMIYPSDVREIKDKNSQELVRVDFDWKEYPNISSFLNTAHQENAAVPIATELGLFATQIKQAIGHYHIDNIEKGVAVALTQTQQ